MLSLKLNVGHFCCLYKAELNWNTYYIQSIILLNLNKCGQTVSEIGLPIVVQTTKWPPLKWSPMAAIVLSHTL